MDLSIEDIDNIKKDIEKALPGELSLVKDCLDRLAEVKATEELLRITEVGAFINKLRKNPDLSEELVNQCKDIVRKWKDDVGHSEKKEIAKHEKEKHGKLEPKPVGKPDKVKEDGSKEAKVKEEKIKVEIKSDSQADSQASVQDAPPDTPTIERKEGRTPKDDNVTLNRTGHTARDKCAEMIYTSLSYVTWANPEIIANKATSVEQLTWEEYGKKDADNSAYKNRVRTIVFNLKAKDNPALRERVVMGELAVPDFCKMSTSDMASDDLKKEWEKIQKQNLMDAQIHADNSAETDMFKCGKCKQRRTKYYQMQTRSADEPMTTFVTCLVCNNRWKFC